MGRLDHPLPVVTAPGAEGLLRLPSGQRIATGDDEHVAVDATRLLAGQQHTPWRQWSVDSNRAEL
ncbi:hypothetical protein D3C81_1969380 [compost metagenome]